MKKANKVLLSLMVLCMPLLAAAEGKVAVLNVQEAILNTEAAQSRLKALRAGAMYSENLKELEKLKQEHDDTIKQLQKDMAVMSADQKQAESKKIQEKRADIEHVARKLQAAEQELAQSLAQEMAPRMQQIVAELIQAEGIGLLIDRKAVMHVDSSFSITAKVTDKLNQANAN